MPRPYEEPRHDPPYHPYTTHKSLQRWESLWEQDTPLTGTNYPTRTSILADLADEDGPLLRPVPNVSFHTAVRHLVSLHDSHRPLSPAQAAAVARLRTLHALNSSGEWFADLPCKIFTDLDTLLFGSKLRGNVCVRYCTIKSNPETAEDSAGVSAPGEYMTTAGHLSRRLFLTINADRLIIDGRRTLKDLVGALVHEMTVSLAPIFQPLHKSVPFNHPPTTAASRVKNNS